MLRMLRLLAFHLRQHVKVGYFLQLLVLSTTIPLIVQALSPETVYSTLSWLRAAALGCWTSATTAAGILGFERMRGTLPYLLLSRIHPRIALASSPTACALFGLLAFPLAFAEWIGLAILWGLPLPTLSLTQGLAVLLFWLGCWALSVTIAWLFLLTPHALIYEGLLVAPILLCSGIFASAPAEGLMKLSILLPLHLPLEGLYFPTTFSPQNILLSLVVTALWLLIAYAISSLALKRIRVTGALEVM